VISGHPLFGLPLLELLIKVFLRVQHKKVQLIFKTTTATFPLCAFLTSGSPPPVKMRSSLSLLFSPGLLLSQSELYLLHVDVSFSNGKGNDASLLTRDQFFAGPTYNSPPSIQAFFLGGGVESRECLAPAVCSLFPRCLSFFFSPLFPTHAFANISVPLQRCFPVLPPLFTLPPFVVLLHFLLPRARFSPQFYCLMS